MLVEPRGRMEGGAHCDKRGGMNLIRKGSAEVVHSVWMCKIILDLLCVLHWTCDRVSLALHVSGLLVLGA